MAVGRISGPLLKANLERNGIARSAEAANEIKTLVQNATDKANHGKTISDKMIEGYTGLNSNISKTIELINDVEVSSNEQKNGIVQINDAINALDKQTQQNAAIASQTQSVAVQTDSIAKLIVTNANEKEFEGKNEVQGDRVNKSEISKTTVTPKAVSPKKTTQDKPIKPQENAPINPIVSKGSDDEWESF